MVGKAADLISEDAERNILEREWVSFSVKKSTGNLFSWFP
jgi:hypothetical protein